MMMNDNDGSISTGKLRELVTEAINGINISHKPTQVKGVCDLLDMIFSGKVKESNVNMYHKGTERVNAGRLSNTALAMVPSLNSIGSYADLKHWTNEFARILAARELVTAYEALDKELNRGGLQSALQQEAARINRLFETQPGYNKANYTKYVLLHAMWKGVGSPKDRIQKLNTWMQVGGIAKSLGRLGSGVLILVTMGWSDLSQINIKALDVAMDTVQHLELGSIFEPFNTAVANGKKFGTVVFKKDEETLEAFFRRISW